MMRTTVLLYHDIVAAGGYAASGFQGADADIYKLDREEFRRHLDVIARHPGEKPEAISGAGWEGPGKRLLLTFDDGGASALPTAALLDEYGWPGYFFMTTGYIGAPGFLDASALRALARGGHVVGSHSCSHPLRMPACPAAQLDSEWRDSVRRLEDVLGEAVTTGSIPGGGYSRSVVRAAAAAGIRVLFTSEPVTRVRSVDGCLTIGRFAVQQGVPAAWVAAVVAGRVLPRARRYLAWNGKKLLKAAGGPVWLAARKAILARRAATGRTSGTGA